LKINADDQDLLKKKYEDKLKDLKDNCTRKLNDQNEQIEALSDKKVKLKNA